MTPEVVLVLDRGIVELVVPEGWPVLPQPGGSIKITDPRDDCSLEISYLRTAGLTVTLPVARFLEQVLADTPEAVEHGRVDTADRGPTRLAWCTYPFESMDTERNERRRAFGRWLLASRGEFHALLTCYWWEDDDAWARAAVERACESLALGDGIPLRSPAEHWAMRKRN
jgi:hypothetical protein